jgi:hypothetical protein
MCCSSFCFSSNFLFFPHCDQVFHFIFFAIFTLDCYSNSYKPDCNGLARKIKYDFLTVISLLKLIVPMYRQKIGYHDYMIPLFFSLAYVVVGMNKMNGANKTGNLWLSMIFSFDKYFFKT